MIQKANISQIDDILNLLKIVKINMIPGIWEDNYPNKEILTNDILNNNSLIYIIDNQIVGYLAYFLNLESLDEEKYQIHNNYYFITRVMVNPNYTNKKIASTLFQYLFKQNLSSYRINVSPINTKALNLYNKLGFKIIYKNNDTCFCEKIIDIT